MFEPPTAPIIPFDYQIEQMESLWKWWKDNGPESYPLIVAAPGAGKTVLSAMVMKRLRTEYYGITILFLAHRKELIEQTEKKLLAYWPEAPVGVYSSGLGRKEIRPIVVAGRDTIAPALQKELRRYSPSIIIIDEAHNVSKKENTRYQVIINTLKERSRCMMLFGVTATPFRSDQGRIYGNDGEVFSGIAHHMGIRQLLDIGRLCPLRTKQVSEESKVDTSDIKIQAGEFNIKQLEEKSVDHSLIACAINEWVLKAITEENRKHTLFFCVSVAHAEAVQTELAIRGYACPLVTGNTQKGERERTNKNFLAGKHIGLINVGVYTEGTDFPLIDCICNLRAMNSLVLYIQSFGRGMRDHPGKDDCLVLDFGGCVERFGPIDIAQPAAKRGKPDKRTKDCPECNEIVGFRKRKCTCGFEFEKPSFKECPKCGEENPPAAGICISCNELFAKHDREASSAEIISSTERFKKIKVTSELYCRGMVAKGSGKEYLMVLFPISYTKNLTRNLMLGHPGASGERAKRQWESMTFSGITLAADVSEAMRIVSSMGAENVFKKVQSVTIDTKSEYKEIRSIEYAE